MFRISSELLKSIHTKRLIGSKYSFKSFKFWSKTNDSSNSNDKSKGRVSLAYYSLDPHYLSSNKPNPIIVYHSLLTSKEMYENSVRDLVRQTGRTTYLLDMRNHGESPHTTADESDLKHISKDVIDFMDEFSISKAILIGHSVGSLAMLRTSLDFSNRVEKVVAMDIMPNDFSFYGPKLINLLVYSVSSLPQHISLSNAKLIVKQQLNPFFTDKIQLYYILTNLSQDVNGFIKWRFNLPVIRQLILKGVGRLTVSSDRQFDGQVLMLNGKYCSMTAHNYSLLKQSFPNSKFDSYQRYRHKHQNERPKKLVNVLTSFIGKPTNDSK